MVPWADHFPRARASACTERPRPGQPELAGGVPRRRALAAANLAV